MSVEFETGISTWEVVTFDPVSVNVERLLVGALSLARSGWLLWFVWSPWLSLHEELYVQS